MRRRGALIASVLLTMLLGASAAQAAPVTVGFDDLPAGTSANEAYAALGLHFGVTPQGGAEGAVTVVATPIARSPANAGAFEYNSSNDFSTAWLRFDTPQSQVSFHACAASGSGLNVNATAYNRLGEVVSQANGVPCTPGSLAPVTLYGAANIAYIGIGNSGGGWVIDDITFDGAPTGPPAAPDFTLGPAPNAPTALAVAPGATATYPLAITRNEGSSGRIGVAVSGLPAGVTATVDPAEVGGTANGFPVLRVTAARDAAPTQRTIRVTATPLDGSAGGAARTLDLPLIVQGRLAVRIEGMEVTQAVQTYEQPTRRPYNGVRLVRGKKTVVRVFADLVGTAAARARRPSFGMVLFAGGVNGRERPGSPLLPEWSPNPRDLSVNDGGLLNAERDSETGAFTFVLPDSWARETLTLTALAVGTGEDQTTAETQLCLATSCGATPTWTLRGIRFHTPPPAQNVSALKLPQVQWVQVPIIVPFIPVPLLVWTPTNPPVIRDFEVDPRRVFQKLQALSPVQIHFYTTAGGATDWPSWRAVRFAPSHQIWEAADAWDESMGRPGLATAGVFVAGDNPGVTIGHTAVVSGRVQNDGSIWRPVTSVAHEIFHRLGFAHASTSCGAGDGEDWPVADGRMNSVGLDTTPGSGRTGPFRVIADRDASPRYDLMSYCGIVAGDGNHWISAHNWNRALGVAPPPVSRPIARRLLTARVLLTAGATPALTVGSATGPATPGQLPSAYTLIARDAAGNVLHRVPLTQLAAGRSGGLATDPVALEARVPPEGVASVEVVDSAGAPVTARSASANAPRVRITAPAAGARISGSADATVRFRATDADAADAGRLTARIELSTDGGRSWDEVWSGAAVSGVARIPEEALLATRRARLRIVVSDGFRETTATGGTFAIAGKPPAVQITEPVRGTVVPANAAIRLEGGAIDDRGRALRGARLVWRAGRRVLGRGETVTAPLPAGTRRVTLTATDRNGRRARATVAVRTKAARPYFLRLRVAGRAPRSGGTVAVVVASTQPGTVRAGGRTTRVGVRPRTIRVRVRAGRAPARVTVTLRAGGRSTTSTLLVRRR